MGDFLYPLNVFQDVQLDYCYFCSRDGEYWPEDLRSDPNFNGKEYWTEDLRTDPNFNGKEYLRRRRHRMAPSRPWAKARARSSRDVQTVLAEHSIHTAQDLANLSGHAWKALLASELRLAPRAREQKIIEPLECEPPYHPCMVKWSMPRREGEDH